MKWILNRDLERLITSEIRQIVMGNNEDSLEDTFDTAIEMASSYIKQRYDVAKIFYDIPQFDRTGEDYLTGDVIRSNTDQIYVVLTDAPGSTLSDSAKYQAKDPRNKQLVQVVIDIGIYDLHSRISPRNIPELRQKRYDRAMEWLNKVQKETIIPDLPLLEDATSQTFNFSEGNKTAERW